MYQDNNWYGHRKVFLDYCNINYNYNALAATQHGWMPIAHRHILGKRSFDSVIPFLCWSKSVEQLVKKYTTNTHTIGAPFIYLHEIKKKKKYNSKGTLVFPTHNTPEIKTQFKHEKLIDIVESQEEGPYTVCLYYTDHKKKNINIYKKKKWKVVCCGNRRDENFLFKLYNHISNAKSVVCSELTSPLFYSMYLNKKTRIINKYKIKNRYYSISEVEMWNFEISSYKFFKKRYPSIFKKGLKLKKGKELADIELGTKYLKSKKTIKKLMGWDNFLKIYLAKLFAFLMDLKYKKNLRQGKAIRQGYSKKEYNNLLSNQPKLNLKVIK